LFSNIINKKPFKYFPFWELLYIFGLMRVIAKGTLRDFWHKHADSEQPLKAWYQETSKNAWEHPNDIKTEYPSASILANGRIVFNIKGNHYRLIVKINYKYQMVWIRFIGTHAEYDKIDAENI
jgi:mRNA interferase HigB